MGYFLPFHLPNSPKIQNLEKMKKTPGDIILGHFLPFYHPNSLKNQNPLTAQKIKIKKKWKKMPGDIILHMFTKNYNQMMYSSWDMVCDGQIVGKQTEGKSDI